MAAQLKEEIALQLEALLPKRGSVTISNLSAASLHIHYTVSNTSAEVSDLQGLVETDAAHVGSLRRIVARFYPGTDDEVVFATATATTDGIHYASVFQIHVDSEITIGSASTAWTHVLQDATAVETIKASLASDLATALGIDANAVTIHSISADPHSNEATLVMSVSGTALSAAEVRAVVGSNITFGETEASLNAPRGDIAVNDVSSVNVIPAGGTRAPVTPIPVAARASNVDAADGAMPMSSIIAATIGALALLAVAVAAVAIVIFVCRAHRRKQAYIVEDAPETDFDAIGVPTTKHFDGAEDPPDNDSCAEEAPPAKHVDAEEEDSAESHFDKIPEDAI